MNGFVGRNLDWIVVPLNVCGFDAVLGCHHFDGISNTIRELPDIILDTQQQFTISREIDILNGQ